MILPILRDLLLYFERKENADKQEEITEEEYKEVDNDIILKQERKENLDNLEHKEVDNDISLKHERNENEDDLERTHKKRRRI